MTKIYVFGPKERANGVLDIADAFLESPIDYPLLNSLFRACRDYSRSSFMIVTDDAESSFSGDLEMLDDYLREHASAGYDFFTPDKALASYSNFKPDVIIVSAELRGVPYDEFIKAVKVLEGPEASQ